MGLEEKNASLAALQAQSADALLHSLNSHIKQQPFLPDLPGGKNRILQVNKNDFWPLLSSDVFAQWTFCLRKSEADNHITAEIKCQLGFSLMGGNADGSDTINKRGASFVAIKLHCNNNKTGLNNY